MTAAEPPGSETAGVQAIGNDPAVRARIKAMVRTARQERGLTQAQLGKQIGASRFVINRIEAGVTDITPDLAERLEEALGLIELHTLVVQRGGPGVTGDNRRDAVLDRLLTVPGLQRLRIVLADETDLYPLIWSWADGDSVLRSEDVEIIIPTVARGRALFGDGSPLYGHLQFQVKRLLDLKKSMHYVSNSLRLFESDEVVASVVVAATATGTEAALWPSMAISGGPGAEQAGRLPVGVTVDQQVIAGLEGHLDALVGTREPIRSNEAICRIEPGERSRPVFTRYFTVGEDQEGDVDSTEGVAVVLVLAIALCPRGRYGVGRRVITYLRTNSRQDRRRSLFSNPVEDIDVQRTRAIENGGSVSEKRSNRSALAAALETNDYLESKGKIIPDQAFRYAAAREMAMFQLNVDPDRFQPVELPAELQLISKPTIDGVKRAAIAPRLFILELDPDPARPELAILEDKADVEQVGRLDLAKDTNLNDFLAVARDSGFLETILAEHGIADR